MKRIFILFFIVVGTFSLYGQQAKGVNLEKFTMDLSVQTGLPVLNMKGSSIGVGPAFQLGYTIDEKIAVSGNIGYNRFGAKGKSSSGTNYLYLLGGVHYFIKDPIHLDAFLGYASFKGVSAANPFFPNGIEFNNNGPAFAAGAGYRLNQVFDVALKFQKSKTVSFIGLGLSIRFVQ